MVLEDLARSPYAIHFDDLPSHVADAGRWFAHCDDLREAGTPEEEIPDFQTWRVARNGN
jgi:hypothetical protein